MSLRCALLGRGAPSAGSAAPHPWMFSSRPRRHRRRWNWGETAAAVAVRGWHSALCQSPACVPLRRDKGRGLAVLCTMHAWHTPSHFLARVLSAPLPWLSPLRSEGVRAPLPVRACLLGARQRALWPPGAWPWPALRAGSPGQGEGKRGRGLAAPRWPSRRPRFGPLPRGWPSRARRALQ